MRITRRALFLTFVSTSVLTAILSPVRSARAAGAEAPLSAHDACKLALAREGAGQPTASSRGPCHKAFVLGSLPEDLRNEVASMTSPAQRTTLDDLALGSMMSDAAIRTGADQPWGYLARCDIARRLGDADTMAACLADLRRVAPTHPITKWALASAAERPPLAVWVLRCLLLVGLLGTAAHATLAARRARSGRGRGPAVALFVASAVLLGPGVIAAHAAPADGKDHLSDFSIDDANPEASVPPVEDQTKNPLEFGYFLQDLAAKAEHASNRGDHAAAARFYGALGKAAPTVGYGPRKMCVELEAAGDLPRAVLACRSVLTRLGTTVDDFTRFVALTLGQKDPLPAGERQELDAVIKHLADETQLGAVPTVLRCEVALRFKDMPALAACTAKLEKQAPNDPKTVSFQWALALQNHDRGAALSLIERAKKLGMNPAGVAKMEEDTRTVLRSRTERLALLAFAAALIAWAIWIGRRQLLSRRQAPV